MGVNWVTFVAPNLAWGEEGASPASGAVTDEQRSPRPNSAQPSGRRFFSAQAALLAPYRSTGGICAGARAEAPRVLPGPKTPRRKRHRIYALDHLVHHFINTATFAARDFWPADSLLATAALSWLSKRGLGAK